MSRNDSPDIPDSQPTVGRQLRAAREAAGVSPEDFAREANLTVRQVQAIETDEYSWFNGPVFIKGYIRVYAKRFGLNGDVLIKQFEQANPEEQPKPMGAPMRPQPLRPSHDFKFRQPKRAKRVGVVIAGLLLLAIAVGLLGWWLSQRNTESNVQPVTEIEAPALDQLSAIESGEAQMSLSTVVDGAPLEAATEAPLPTSALQSPLPEELTSSTTTAPAASPTAAEETPTTAALTPADAVPDAATAAVEASVATADSAAALQETAELPVDEEQQKLLRLEFSDECWVQIKNAQGRVIHERIHKAGDALDLDVVPPVQLWFGRARAVNVTYNGTAVALPVHSGSNSVKFTFTDAQGQSVSE